MIATFRNSAGWFVLLLFATACDHAGRDQAAAEALLNQAGPLKVHRYDDRNEIEESAQLQFDLDGGLMLLESRIEAD